MPRNRREIPKEQRAGEILTAATELFLDRGYADTTMSDIAARVGATPASVYWYYSSKDVLFAAVMDQMLTREILALEQNTHGLSPISRMTQGLVDLRSYRPLHQAMHHRMEHSPQVRRAHDRFLDWIRAMALEVLAERPTKDPEMVADLVVCIFEGGNVMEPPPTSTSEMISYLLQNLTSQG